MRIAWLGSARDGGGVPGMGGLLLEGLLDRGARLTCSQPRPTANSRTRYAGIKT